MGASKGDIGSLDNSSYARIKLLEDQHLHGSQNVSLQIQYQRDCTLCLCPSKSHMLSRQVL